MKHPRHAAALAAGLAALAPVLVSSPALAGDGSGDRVTRSGSCTAGARWDIKAQEDDGRIEVEAEIDSNGSGQRWTWRLVHNGSFAGRGTARTAGRSGSFSVERQVVDNPDSDTITFRATHDGQRCVARLRY